LLLHGAVDVSGVAGENELIVIALDSEYGGHAFVSENPVVHVIAHDVGIQQVAVANLQPDAQGLGRAIGDEMLVKFPGAVRRLRIVGPLLVYKSSGLGENAVIQLRVIPRHDQGARTT
jgi:hypothetical protein